MTARVLLRLGQVLTWLAIALALANLVGMLAGRLPWWLIGLPAPITLLGLVVCLVGLGVRRWVARRAAAEPAPDMAGEALFRAGRDGATS